jgi:mannitol/fructose-specific phosphotransferase system IIA component (Ntr-type)
MNLPDVLTPQLVLYPLEAASKDEAISQLINVLVKNGQLHNIEEAKAAVFARERLMTTGVGQGVALPHGKFAYTDEVLIAFGISKMGVDFEAIDGQPAYIFVLLLTPEKFPSKHLALLSKFSKMLNSEDCRKELMAASSAERITDILYQYEDTV